jgi:hypothetical protein
MANADPAACAADKEQCRSLASAISLKVRPRFDAFWQQCSLARVVSANTAAQSTNSQQIRSAADTNSANSAARLADSWRRCALALLANAFSCAAISWQCGLSALSAAAHSADIAAHDAVNSAHDAANAADAFSMDKSIAVFTTDAVIAAVHSRAAWQVCSLANTFFCAAALCCCHCSTIATRAQHSCLYCRRARAASCCCRHAVVWVRRIWRRRWQSQRKMVVAAAVRHAWAVRASKRCWPQAVSLSRSH